MPDAVMALHRWRMPSRSEGWKSLIRHVVMGVLLRDVPSALWALQRVYRRGACRQVAGTLRDGPVGFCSGWVPPRRDMPETLR
ncbi:hypothetical protein GCM10009849_29450 [Sinomonas flava]|uniref:Uncharacterized protein n=1 Tax=Sinomonas flava TaxID=496857 RepID=A0ABN3BZ66_9MICC